MKQPKLAVIIPCFNEEACINNTSERLLQILDDLSWKQEISQESFLFFIDDGSSDNTWNLIEAQHINAPDRIKGIKFSRNFGNQKAILAGILESSKYNADCLISIDADLQQDEFKIGEFIQKYKQGADIVCGIRNDRRTDGFLKKTSALAFYKLMNVMGVNIQVNHSDYRLISLRAAQALKNFPEKNLFLRGIFNELGFKRDYVYFDVKPRRAGRTKYTARSLFSLALEGITSFSIVPLRFVFFIGILMSLASFIVGLSAWWEKFFYHSTIPGWATIVAALGFIGGIQILCIGIIGEYLGQLFQEIKARPRYIIEKELNQPVSGSSIHT